MKILFDQGVPVPLRRALPAHSVSTAYEIGWAELSNRALLKKADAEFDNPVAALQDWKNLMINGFNNEWDTLQRENLKLIELTEEFNKEILARGGQISVAPPAKS